MGEALITVGSTAWPCTGSYSLLGSCSTCRRHPSRSAIFVRSDRSAFAFCGFAFFHRSRGITFSSSALAPGIRPGAVAGRAERLSVAATSRGSWAAGYPAEGWADLGLRQQQLKADDIGMTTRSRQTKAAAQALHHNKPVPTRDLDTTHAEVPAVRDNLAPDRSDKSGLPGEVAGLADQLSSQCLESSSDQRQPTPQACPRHQTGVAASVRPSSSGGAATSASLLPYAPLQKDSCIRACSSTTSMSRPAQGLQPQKWPASAGSTRFSAQPERCAGRPLPVEAWQDAQLRCCKRQICKGCVTSLLLSCEPRQQQQQQQQQRSSLHLSSTGATKPTPEPASDAACACRKAA